MRQCLWRVFQILFFVLVLLLMAVLSIIYHGSFSSISIVLNSFTINLWFALFYCDQPKNNNYGITVYYFGYKSNILERTKISEKIKKLKTSKWKNWKNFKKSKVARRQDFHHIKLDRNVERIAKYKKQVAMEYKNSLKKITIYLEHT